MIGGGETPPLVPPLVLRPILSRDGTWRNEALVSVVPVVGGRCQCDEEDDDDDDWEDGVTRAVFELPLFAIAAGGPRLPPGAAVLCVAAAAIGSSRFASCCWTWWWLLMRSGLSVINIIRSFSCP